MLLMCLSPGKACFLSSLLNKTRTQIYNAFIYKLVSFHACVFLPNCPHICPTIAFLMLFCSYNVLATGLFLFVKLASCCLVRLSNTLYQRQCLCLLSRKHVNDSKFETVLYFKNVSLSAFTMMLYSFFMS
jgi:hypothetical protein